LGLGFATNTWRVNVVETRRTRNQLEDLDSVTTPPRGRRNESADWEASGTEKDSEKWSEIYFGT